MSVKTCFALGAVLIAWFCVPGGGHGGSPPCHPGSTLWNKWEHRCEYQPPPPPRESPHCSQRCLPLCQPSDPWKCYPGQTYYWNGGIWTQNQGWWWTGGEWSWHH